MHTKEDRGREGFGAGIFGINEHSNNRWRRNMLSAGEAQETVTNLTT